MKNNKIKLHFLALVALAVIFSTLLLVRRGEANADSPSIVINEIMYNPQSGVDNDEFLEIYNTTSSTIDLTGWCFTAGITLCFSPGTTINAHSYGLVSPNATRTLATYGKTTIGTYTGKLDNGGERVTLSDNSAQMINSVLYDDAPPWPTSPDGAGHSLELKDPSLDNSQATNWAASLVSSTPGEENSHLSVSLPSISSVSEPSNVDQSQEVGITANVTDSQSVDLVYQVGFDGDITLPMFDDGAHGDGAEADGTYGATIPAQESGKLVRFKVVASGLLGTSSSPSVDDSQDYHGYVVNDGVTSNAPILRWFISDATYADILDNPIDDESYRESVIAYDGKVYDNTQVRVKGEYSRSFPKKAFKFKLPSGYTINMAGGSNRAISEFHVNSNWQDGSGGLTSMAWWVVANSGLPSPDVTPLRIQKNGEFQGLYIYAEKYEKEWRQENNYTSGHLYEDYGQVRTGDPNDTSDITSWRSSMSAFKDQTKRDYVLDNNNIPNIISYTAVQALLASHDNSAYSNTFEYHDTANTGRWSLLAWDLDLLFYHHQAKTFTSPYDTVSYIPAEDKFPTTAIYQQKDLRDMYFRRLRTLIDKFYSNDSMLNKFNEEVSKYEPEMVLDNAKWPGDTFDDPVIGFNARPRRPADEIRNEIEKQKVNFLIRFRKDWAIPEAQTQQARESVYIDEVNKDSDTANEYIKLSNSSDEYVDISDWHIDGIDYTLPAGSVVPAHGSIYIVNNDVGYRATHDPVFIAGQYTNSLNSAPINVLVLKSEDGQAIDDFTTV